MSTVSDCWFCGSSNVDTDFDNTFIGCLDCGASGPAADNDKCIEAWNREKAPAFHRVERADFTGTASYFYTSESASESMLAGFLIVCHTTGALRLNACLDYMTGAQAKQWGEMLVAAADFADQLEVGQ